MSSRDEPQPGEKLANGPRRSRRRGLEVCLRPQEFRLGFYHRCERCGHLRPDERASRQELRARDCEIGRGGGFFQRSSTNDRNGWDSDGEEFDEFGRKKRKPIALSDSSGAKILTAAADANVETHGGHAREGQDPCQSSRRSTVTREAEMSDRHKAALARLRAGVGGKRHRSRSRSGPR
eukprot:CAMPEP_0170387602 /NCGR_PEP_ID=MMETSP0117_2-20130122/17644_1 /TAXON_ID=400756 /ORGANISM="Durinskia baltica, Strain CSIRO CS-38" /LENGTH=178 /DNA_ID=CAMNT_0010643479 /DNA_START=36 /DNA_END=569 /DNA_ORIENTATION=+